jgi:hypothetical protein
MKNAPWLYLVLGAVLLYVLWGRRYTVAIDDGVRVGRPAPVPPAGAAATLGDQINWALVDELPL